jgi:hypothetical protein
MMPLQKNKQIHTRHSWLADGQRKRVVPCPDGEKGEVQTFSCFHPGSDCKNTNAATMTALETTLHCLLFFFYYILMQVLIFSSLKIWVFFTK